MSAGRSPSPGGLPATRPQAGSLRRGNLSRDDVHGPAAAEDAQTHRATASDLAPDRAALPKVSVVLCTLNRRVLLDGALAALAAQEEAPPFEVLLVDNGSTDDTASFVKAMVPRFPNLRYVHEPRRGLAHARNTGVARARGEYIAFTDDDVRVARDWVRRMVEAFEASPEAACVGGAVLPRWPAPPEAWLTRAHWSPLALVDYGPQALVVSAARPLCLVGANVAFRAGALATAGGFSSQLQRVGDSIGSVEDDELLMRLWQAGRHGVYWPALRVEADVQPERMGPAYHRRWHRGHGHFLARMESRTLEASRLGTVFGVPAHLYRQAAVDLLAWTKALLRRDTEGRLSATMRLQFFAGFVAERVRRGRPSRPRGASTAPTHAEGRPTVAS